MVWRGRTAGNHSHTGITITQIAFAVCVFTLFAVIYSSVVLSRYAAFEPKLRMGTIVDKYVSHRDTMVAATASITEPHREGWTDHKFVVPIIGGHWQARNGGNGGGRRSKGHHVNAIIEYTVNAGRDAEVTKQCTMTMHDYASEEHAHAGLDRVPLGKQKEVHVSKSHDGKYCTSKSKLRSYFIGGVSVLGGLGVIYIIAGGLLTYIYLRDKNSGDSVPTTVPTADIELQDTPGRAGETRMATAVAAMATERNTATAAAHSHQVVSAGNPGIAISLGEAVEDSWKPIEAIVIAQRLSHEGDLESGPCIGTDTGTCTSTETPPAGSIRLTAPPRRLSAYLPVAAAFFQPRSGGSTPSRSPRTPPVVTAVPLTTAGSSARRDIPWC